MSQKFETLSELTKEYRRFNTAETQLTLRLNPPLETDIPPDPVSHLLANVNDCLSTLYKT